MKKVRTDDHFPLLILPREHIFESVLTFEWLTNFI